MFSFRGVLGEHYYRIKSIPKNRIEVKRMWSCVPAWGDGKREEKMRSKG